jgi:hypothetical protein
MGERLEDETKAPVPPALHLREASTLEPLHLGPEKAQDPDAEPRWGCPERALQATEVRSELRTHHDTLESDLQASGKTIERRPDPGCS